MIMLLLTFDTTEETNKFVRIYEKYNRILFGIAMGILKDQGLAEDASQEAFIRLAHNLHKVADGECKKTGSYLLTIVKNICYTMLKQGKQRSMINIDDLRDDIEDNDVRIEESVVSSDSVQLLAELIGELKEELRAPFLLFYYQDFSTKEIAQTLNITEDNTSVRIYRAKKKLRQLLTEQEGEYNGRSETVKR